MLKWKKMYFKKSIIVIMSLLLFVFTIPIFAGCGGNKIKDSIKVEEIDQYFYNVGTYKSFDYDFVNQYFTEHNDNWGGGCSAISKVIDGNRIVGRNMDLNISNKCAYVVRTKVPNKYETIGLSYTFRDVSPDYEIVKSKGLTAEWQKILPFMCDDVLNSEGLYIELNMRHGEQDSNGNDLFSVEHTNPNVSERVYVFNLCQYFALNCKNIQECEQYLAEEIDVYSQKNYWNYCFLIADAEGNSKLLEFGNGTYYWVEPDSNGIIGQTNYYQNPTCYALERVKTGLGRYKTLKDEISEVNNKQDMFKLMNKISYSWYYQDYDECKDYHFDPRSEIIGENADKEALENLASYIHEKFGVSYIGELGLTEEFVMNNENEEFIRVMLNIINSEYRTMSRKALQNENSYWESTFTEVVDPANKTIELRLFENNSYMYKLTFDGISKIGSISN